MRSLQVFLTLAYQTLSSQLKIMEASFLQALFVVGGLVLLLWFLIQRRSSIESLTEISNEWVAISELQVVLVANTKLIQQEFSTLVLNAETQSASGLKHLLQESVSILLKYAESWTHVYAESQKMPNLDIARKVLTQMTLLERSNMSSETLVNASEHSIQTTSIQAVAHEDTAAYIVVTLLVGTHETQTLFQDIRTGMALQIALEEAVASPPSSLCFLELIWNPQNPSELLNKDKLLSTYTDLIKI